MEVNQPPDYYFEAYFNRRYLAHFVHKRQIDRIVSLVPERSSVLDAGCGSGIVPFLLSAYKACTGVGVDIRQECVEFASGKIPAFPSRLYFFIEPLWKMVRKLLHPSTVFDDTECHYSIPAARVVHLLKERQYEVEKVTSSSMGLVNLIIARKK